MCPSERVWQGVGLQVTVGVLWLLAQSAPAHLESAVNPFLFLQGVSAQGVSSSLELQFFLIVSRL